MHDMSFYLLYPAYDQIRNMYFNKLGEERKCLTKVFNNKHESPDNQSTYIILKFVFNTFSLRNVCGLNLCYQL